MYDKGGYWKRYDEKEYGVIMLRLKINELAYIKEADIRLDGVTCIAGVNNTGKSTVGKALFSLIYSLTNYQNLFEDDRNLFIRDRLRFIRILLNKIDKTDVDMDLNLVNFDPADLELLQAQMRSLDDNDSKRVIELIDEIIYMMEKDVNDTEIKKEIVEQIILRTFENQVSPLHSNNHTVISVLEGISDILYVEMKQNKIRQFNLQRELPFNQVVYIESPYVLQLFNTSEVFSRGRRSGRIPDYIHDLLYKMTNTHPSQDSLAEKIMLEQRHNTTNDISKLIGGEMYFDPKHREFYFKDTSIDEPIKMANVASGVKSLSMVHKLLQNGWLDELSILIIDEPENHLHPSWQIEFARFLVSLNAESNIKILITSHSPYFIEAIDVFSKQKNIQDKTTFYSADPGRNGTIIKNVTHRLEAVFTLLSKPLEDLEKERLRDDTD